MASPDESHGQRPEDMFSTVAWENTNPLGGEGAAVPHEPSANDTSHHYDASLPSASQPAAAASSSSQADPPNVDLSDPRINISVQVCDPVKELEGNYVSYHVTGSTHLPQYTSRQFSSRRRFQDFKFLRDHLTKDFPACVVPPLPDKHRMEYLTGDRFSLQFVERRRMDLQRFLRRVARHSTLSRSILLQQFLESTEWTVHMHQHIAHPPTFDSPPSLLDNLSDTFLNAFSKIRKPDERFVDVRDRLDKFEESLQEIERIQSRARSRIEDLSSDYEDFAASFQVLGYRESGITEQLSYFDSSLSEFALTLREIASASTDPFLNHLHSLLAYSSAFKAVLKLRDQKQVDFEDLTAYLSSMTTDRDRLASGHSTSPGIGGFLKSKTESLRGAPPEDRDTKILKLDNRIKELQEAVTSAHDILDRFNAEVLKEQHIFQAVKQVEMKELMTSLADSQINLYTKASDDWEKCIPALKKIHDG